MLIALAVLALVAGTAGYVYVQRMRVALDEVTLCPKEGFRALTVVLVDRTDGLETVQRDALRQHLNEIKASVNRYEALQVYAVGPIGESLLRPIANLCNPGRGDDIDPVTGSPRLVERRWRDEFSTPLDALLDEMVATDEASTSPIMESIQSIAVSAFRGDPAADVPKRLIIASDMLQHTDGYSHYRSAMEFQEFHETGYFRRLRTDLRGVEVEIIYIRRDTRRAAQGTAHILFWRDYIGELGGVVTRVVALEG